MIHAVLICEPHCFVPSLIPTVQDPSQHVWHPPSHQVLYATPPILSDRRPEDLLSHFSQAGRSVQFPGCTGARGVPRSQGRLRRTLEGRVPQLCDALLCLRRRWRRKRTWDTGSNTGMFPGRTMS